MPQVQFIADKLPRQPPQNQLRQDEQRHRQQDNGHQPEHPPQDQARIWDQIKAAQNLKEDHSGRGDDGAFFAGTGNVETAKCRDEHQRYSQRRLPGCCHEREGQQANRKQRSEHQRDSDRDRLKGARAHGKEDQIGRQGCLRQAQMLGEHDRQADKRSQHERLVSPVAKVIGP